MKYKWILPDIESSSKIDHDFHSVLLSILERRGLRTKEEIDSFLDKSLQGLHDPFEMINIESAVVRILKSIDKKEPVLIYGDYDVDGITAIAILVQFFRLANAQVDFYIPHRFKEGYGLNKEGIDKAKQAGIRLIITVDTGISNYAEIEYANSLGIDVIITDHHKAPPVLPKAYSILNPNQPSCLYPNKNLSGAGVAFKLVHACLRKMTIDENVCKKFLKNLLDYVTLGTIADLVSLTGENRKIVAAGLKQIPNSTFPGIRIILDQLTMTEKTISAGMIAFRITPKLNASGRTDHGKISARLLIENNPLECRNLFAKLENCNRERQHIEENDLKTALSIIENEKEQLSNSILIVFHPSFHPGVNGIIASRLVEKYHLPAIVFAQNGDGFLKGSARSIKGFSIYESLESCKDLCDSFGGHAFAAGLTINSANLKTFKERINAFMNNNYSKELFEPKIIIDNCISLNEINSSFIDDFKLLEPFGLGNSEPLFLTKNAVIKSTPQVLRGKHVKFNLTQKNSTFEVIGFNLSKHVPTDLKANDKIDIVYRIGINNWLGQEKIQLELVDYCKN